MPRLKNILALGAAVMMLSAGAASAQTLGVAQPSSAAVATTGPSVELAPKVTIAASALRRLTDKGVLQLELTVTNRSDLPVTLYDLGLADNYTIKGIELVDFNNKRKYAMGISNGVCLCSKFDNHGPVKPGEARTVWAWFALPPAEVKQMAVMVANTSPILDVQLQ